MKAKARMLTFLICMIGFVGFGFTTPDLIQNSDAITVSNYDVDMDQVIAKNVVIVNKDFIKDEITLKVTSYDDLSKVIDEAKEIPLENKQALFREFEKPPLKANVRMFYSYKDYLPIAYKHKHNFTYRLARDGLRTINS